MDADALAYITAVETADGQALEEKTKIAIDNFVLGCKADGIWQPSKRAASWLVLAHWLVRWFRWQVLPRPTSTSSLVTTTGRRGWWGMGVRSIWIAACEEATSVLVERQQLILYSAQGSSANTASFISQP